MTAWDMVSIAIVDLTGGFVAGLFSFTYQCGTKGAEKRGPVTISAMRRGDWKKASAALRDRNGWGGEYVSRRFQEGTLLMEVC